MSRALRAKEILTILCPLCGAKPGFKCQLGSGEPRNTSHQDRRWAAKDREPDEEEVWIRPKAAGESSGDNGDVAWRASGSRYLELTYMTLAMKKSA